MCSNVSFVYFMQIVVRSLQDIANTNHAVDDKRRPYYRLCDIYELDVPTHGFDVGNK